MLATVAGLYRVPNVRFDTTIAYTNNPYSGSMRATATSSPRSPSSRRWTRLADRLGLDRLEIRRRNATKSGDVNPQGLRRHLVRDERLSRGRRGAIGGPARRRRAGAVGVG